MLNGLEVTEVLLSELNRELRIDAEYFKKNILKYEKTIKNYKKLKELGTFLIGPFGSTVTADTYVENSDCSYIRGVDIGNFFLNPSDAKIPEVRFNELSKFHIRENDVFITVVGTLGKIAINTDPNLKAIFSCKSTIVRTNEINPYFLTTFLSTDLGQEVVLRGKRGAIQEGLNITDLQEIKVPTVSINFQNHIEALVKSAHQKLEESKKLYREAEQLLLIELRLNDFTPSNECVAVKSFRESFGMSGRLDAEYYQLKYDDIIGRVKGYHGGYKKLGAITTLKKSIEPGSDAYGDEGVQFLRVADLFKYELKEPEIRLSERLFDAEKLDELKPKKGEVLLSKDGSVGITYAMREDANFIPSGAIVRLQQITDILPDVLALILNSQVVQLQAERDAGGSILQHWKPSEINEVLVPLLDEKVQQIIAEKICESFSLRTESKKLLEEAKMAVERAIEHEESAI